METVHEGTTTHQNPSSHLLSLPAEIREAIFEFALTSDKPLVAFRLDRYQRETYEEATPPPLTQVNRQIRNETLPIFFSSNEIVFHTERSKLRDSDQWLRCFRRRLPYLRRKCFWFVYRPLSHDHRESSGVIAIALDRAKGSGTWRVEQTARWVTVTRRPSAFEEDARFLIAQVEELVKSDGDIFWPIQDFEERMTWVKRRYSGFK